MSILLPVHKIYPPEWMRNPDLIKLLDLLNKDDVNARLVGGCIRNNYFGKPVYDIDIACKYGPDKIIDICDENGIRTIPTGIKHGTVTAHINGRNFEITALRSDVSTDGRHADVAFTDDWKQDAKRRDFTMNALYADRDGSIYDPLGEGFQDLQNKKVRFIGGAETRIKEDYLRILRFFRFYAEYHEGDIDSASFNACIKLKDGISTLSDERICDELFKILSLDQAPRAITAMREADMFLLTDRAADELSTLITLQNQLQKPDTPARYNLTSINNSYIKNNKILNFIHKLNELIKSWDGNIKKALYFYDREVVIQGLLTLKAQNTNIDDMVIANAVSMKIPQFPIIASDIMDRFNLSEGPEVGQKMKQAEEIWINSNFILLRDEILEKL